MSVYEYKVIAAPTKGVKARGIKSTEDRFSYALEIKMNEMAAQGWEYQRAESLPSVERSGLTSTKTTWHNVLVFRRQKAAAGKVIAAPKAAEVATAAPSAVAETKASASETSETGGEDTRQDAQPNQAVTSERKPTGPLVATRTTPPAKE